MHGVIKEDNKVINTQLENNTNMIVGQNNYLQFTQLFNLILLKFYYVYSLGVLYDVKHWTYQTMSIFL